MVSRPVANESGVRHKTTAKLPILGHHKIYVHRSRDRSRSHGSGHICNVSRLT